MKCPSCGKAELKAHERRGVEIDICPSCRGVWLDRGELDRLIEIYAAYESEQERRRDREHPGRQAFWQDVFR